MGSPREPTPCRRRQRRLHGHLVNDWVLSLFAVALLTTLTACEGTSDTIATPRESVGSDCPGPVAANEGVVALYTFDGDEGRSQVADSAGDNDGVVQSGLATTVDGPEGCSRAFSFGAGDRYIVIDDTPLWDLEVGSIKSWLWLPAELPNHVGVFSRDRSGREESGHISLFVDVEGRAEIRVQPRDDSSDNSTDAVACSAALLPRQQWVHLGVNFGPPAVELYVTVCSRNGRGLTQSPTNGSAGNRASMGSPETICRGSWGAAPCAAMPVCKGSSTPLRGARSITSASAVSDATSQRCSSPLSFPEGWSHPHGKIHPPPAPDVPLVYDVEKFGGGAACSLPASVGQLRGWILR